MDTECVGLRRNNQTLSDLKGKNAGRKLNSLKSKFRIFLIFLAFATSSSAFAQAEDFSYSIRAGAGYSDNLTRLPSDEVDDTILLVGVDMSFSRESRGFDALVNTDIEYRDYQDRQIDGETIGSIDAELDFKLVPDSFSWIVADTFGQIQSDPFEAETPLNREWLNTFSTGPDIRFAIGAANLIELSGRYVDSNFETSDTDNQSVGGRVSFVRALSRARQFSINFATNDTEFDNSVLNDDFDRDLAYFGFTSETSRSNLVVRLGFNELQIESAKFDGPLIEVSFERDLTSSSGFEISYEQRLTDAADRFRDLDADASSFGDVQNIAGVGDPFEVSSTMARFNFGRGTASLSMFAEHEVNEYLLAVQLDRTRLEYGLEGGWQMGSRVSAALGGTVIRTTFDNTTREDDDFVIRGQLSVRLSRTLQLALELNHLDRDSNNSDFDYTENQAFLTIRYGQ